jgi:hypothetical protein
MPNLITRKTTTKTTSTNTIATTTMVLKSGPVKEPEKSVVNDYMV